jgi:hypothetical protein
VVLNNKQKVDERICVIYPAQTNEKDRGVKTTQI